MAARTLTVPAEDEAAADLGNFSRRFPDFFVDGVPSRLIGISSGADGRIRYEAEPIVIDARWPSSEWREGC